MAKIIMNKFKITLVLLLIATVTFAQKSPRKQATGSIGGTAVTVDYGAPSVKGRTIWGELVPYAKVWRSGANENTTISFDKNVTIAETTVPAGKYGFFMVPSESGAWEVILSKKNDAWGSNGYSKENDQLRLKVTPKTVAENTELLTFTVTKTGVEFAWEKVKIVIPIK